MSAKLAPQAFVQKGEGAARIARAGWVVAEKASLPRGVHRGVALQSPLGDIGRAHAMKPVVGEVAEPREVVEAVGAEGSPVAMDFEHEGALGGFEVKPGERRGGARELGVGRVEQQGAGGRGEGGCGCRGGLPATDSIASCHIAEVWQNLVNCHMSA